MRGRGGGSAGDPFGRMGSLRAPASTTPLQLSRPELGSCTTATGTHGSATGAHVQRMERRSSWTGSCPAVRRVGHSGPRYSGDRGVARQPVQLYSSADDIRRAAAAAARRPAPVRGPVRAAARPAATGVAARSATRNATTTAGRPAVSPEQVPASGAASAAAGGASRTRGGQGAGTAAAGGGGAAVAAPPARGSSSAAAGRRTGAYGVARGAGCRRRRAVGARSRSVGATGADDGVGRCSDGCRTRVAWRPQCRPPRRPRLRRR